MTPTQKRRVEMYRAGSSLKEIAQVEGVSVPTVLTCLMLANEPRRPRGRPKGCRPKKPATIATISGADDPALKWALLEEREQGRTYGELAKDYDLPLSDVVRLINEARNAPHG